MQPMLWFETFQNLSDRTYSAFTSGMYACRSLEGSVAWGRILHELLGGLDAGLLKGQQPPGRCQSEHGSAEVRAGPRRERDILGVTYIFFQMFTNFNTIPQKISGDLNDVKKNP